MTRRLRNLSIALFLLIAAVFIFRKMNIIPSFRDIFSAKPVVIDETPILIQQIKEIAQLMTIEMYDEVVVDSTRMPKAPLPLITYPFNALPLINLPHVVLIVKGRVIAGTDLKGLNKNSIQVVNDSVSIQIPRARILEVIINPSDVETFIEKGAWHPDEVTAVKMKAEARIRQHAMEQNVLPKANEKARLLIENLLKSAGYKKVTVTTL